MLDLLIINPGAVHGIYGPLGDNLVAVEPPLWCRLIADYVRTRGGAVKICDMEAERLAPESVVRLARLLNPKLICVAVYGHQPSASTQQMVGAGAVCSAIKKDGLPIPIVMVGGHPSALPERTLMEESVDFVCEGEGPETVWHLLDTSFELEKVPGLVYRVGSRVRKNPPAGLIDVSFLGGQAWDLLPMHLYKPHNWQCFGQMERRGQPYASIYTTLGCPYKCSFCCINAPFQSNRYRMRAPGDVIAEILHLYWNYRVRTFKIVDEMFVLNERHYTAICQGLIDSGVANDLNIWAYARVDTVKPETLAMLRKAGFRWLALGIESGSKHVRDGAHKALKNDDITGIVRAIQAADINVIGNYIFGLPDDTWASMRETLELALGLNTEFANFYCAMAYPGSQLYTDAQKRGWKLPDSWRGYSQHNAQCTPLPTEHLRAEEVLSFRDEAFIGYFTCSRYLTMVEEKFGRETLEHIKQMTTYKLHRNLLEAA